MLRQGAWKKWKYVWNQDRIQGNQVSDEREKKKDEIKVQLWITTNVSVRMLSETERDDDRNGILHCVIIAIHTIIISQTCLNMSHRHLSKQKSERFQVKPPFIQKVKTRKVCIWDNRNPLFLIADIPPIANRSSSAPKTPPSDPKLCVLD